MATKKINKKNEAKGLTKQQVNIIRLRTKINGQGGNEVKPFTKYKIITYIFNIIFTPYALYRIWCSKSPFNQNEKYVQTGVCITYVLVLIFNIFN